MTTPEPVTDAIAKQIAEIKSEFDLGGYFSDTAHTEKAEHLLDALADHLRAALLLGHPEPPVVGQHRAEAWRAGDRFGWSCLDCTSKAEDVIDATAAERGAEWHSVHPHGLTAPEPVTDPIAELVAAVKHEFNMGGYFSDLSTAQRAELLDSLLRRVPANDVLGYMVLAENGKSGYGSAGGVWPTIEPCENHRAYCQAMVEAGREPFNPGTRYLIVELREVAAS